MKDDLQELRSLRLSYREGGDLREIIDGIITIAKRSSLNSISLTDELAVLKKRVNQLANGFLEGTINRTTYTLEWDQAVRDTTNVIDQLEKVIIDHDAGSK